MCVCVCVYAYNTHTVFLIIHFSCIVGFLFLEHKHTDGCYAKISTGTATSVPPWLTAETDKSTKAQAQKDDYGEPLATAPAATQPAP